MARRKKSATVQLAARMKEPLRARLERAAKARGVSMNAELNRRLEESLTKEEAQIAEFGGEHIYKNMKMLALAVQLVEMKTKKKWLEDNETTSQATSAIYGLLGAFGDVSVEALQRQMLKTGDYTGIQVAKAFLEEMGATDDEARHHLGLPKPNKETR